MRGKKRATWRTRGQRANGILDDERDLCEDDGESLKTHMCSCSDCQVTLSDVSRCMPEYPLMPMSWLHDEYEAIVWGKARRR